MALLTSLVFLVLMIFFSSYLLQQIVILLKLKNELYWTALSVATITNVIAFLIGMIPFRFINIVVLLITMLTGFFLIRYFYDTENLMTAKVLFGWLIAYVIIGMIALIVLGVVSDWLGFYVL